MATNKNKGFSGIIIRLIVSGLMILFILDFVTIPIKYYFMNHAMHYVTEVVKNQDYISKNSEITLDMLSDKLYKYYDNGFMESQPSLYINDEYIDIKGYGQVERLDFPAGEYEIKLKGWHRTVFMNLSLNKALDWEYTKTVKKK